MNKQLRSGLQYSIEVAAGQGPSAFIFDKDKVPDVIIKEKGCSKDDIWFVKGYRLKQIERIYDSPGDMEYKCDEKKYAAIFVNNRMMTEPDFLEFVEAQCAKVAPKIIYVFTVEQTGNKYEWNRFLLSHKNVKLYEVKTDFEKYLANSWKSAFLEEPDFDVKSVIKNLRSYGALDTDVVKSFINCLKNTMGDAQKVPNESDIQTFFRMRSRNWKEKLEMMVGRDDVKQKIRELINCQKYNHLLAQRSVDHLCMAIRLAIMGNPGVGKSHMLDLIIQAFIEEGLCVKGAQIVSARNLIRNHIGESEVKFRELVDKVDLLIIDEIGGLATISEDFTEGLIQMLVYEMENNKNLHIILAGYESDMHKFFEKNSGLRSRIQQIIKMEDYSRDQLVEIGHSMIAQCGYTCDREKTHELLEDFAERVMLLKDYGNARAVRTLVNEIIALKAIEAEAGEYCSTDLNMELEPEMIKAAMDRFFENQLKEKEVRSTIGFR